MACLQLAGTLAGVSQACRLPEPPAAPPELSPSELVEAGHALRAKSILTPLVESDPSNADAAWLLSKALIGLGDLDGALKFADRAVGLMGDNAAYHVQLGAVLGRMAEKGSMFKQLGFARRARKEFETAIVLDPQNVDGLFSATMYYFSAPSFLGGDKAKSAELAAKIAAIDPVRGWLARAAIAREQKDAAELDFILRAARAAAKGVAAFDAQSTLADFYLSRSSRDYAALEEAACKLLELNPDRADGWRALAEVLVASHCWTQLQEALETSERFHPDDLSPYYAAAVALLREDERPSAVRAYLEKYISQPPDGSEPTHALARWQLATLLEKERHPEDAVDQLERALREDPALDAARKDLKRLKGK